MIRAPLQIGLYCVALLAAGLLPTMAHSATSHGFDLSRPEIQSFIAEAAQQRPLTRTSVTRVLRHARPDPGVIDKISRPAETVLPWWQYRANFVSDQRIAEGVQFYLAHRKDLESVANTQGVAPEYIVAILGCETAYGRITGKERVLDSLATLAFDYPQRGEFFRGELLQFLLLAREAHLNTRTVKGSYSGAMGAAQFMPSSYRRYGVDADADHHVDLWNNWRDIFASVANLFKQNGWQSGGPVLAEAALAAGSSAPEPPRLLDPTQTLDGLKAQGITTDTDLPGTTAAVLVAAEQPTGPAYRIGFHNFYVISRYNRSSRYAMAVADLARAIAAGVHAAQPQPAQ